MSRLKKMQEKRKQLNRFQSLKSIFSSLFMTAAVVVVAVTVIPKSPEGEIEKIDAYTNQIVYTVNVTDEDSAIIPGTLKIQLSNQFETYEQSVAIGVTSGIFVDLTAETKYTMKILADKGFGEELLDSAKISTAAKTGGAITGHVLLGEEDDYLLTYDVGYFISDPFDEYQSAQLVYTLQYDEEYDYSESDTVYLTEDIGSVILDSIYNSNILLVLRLEAVTYSSEIVVLDEVSFHTPYRIYASMDLNTVDNQSASLYVYPDSMSDMEIEYEVVLMCFDFLVDRIPVEVQEVGEEHMHYHGSSVTFENLYANTIYTAYLYAKYHDPHTMAYTEKAVTSVEFTTMGDFDYDLVVEEFDTYYEVTITLDDPDEVIDDASSSIYEVTIDGTWYMTGQSYSFDYQDDLKQVSFIVDKPTDYDYEIRISLRNQDQYYYYIILVTLDNNQEE